MKIFEIHHHWSFFKKRSWNRLQLYHPRPRNLYEWNSGTTVQSDNRRIILKRTRGDTRIFPREFLTNTTLLHTYNYIYRVRGHSERERRDGGVLQVLHSKFLSKPPSSNFNILDDVYISRLIFFFTSQHYY